MKKLLLALALLAAPCFAQSTSTTVLAPGTYSVAACPPPVVVVTPPPVTTNPPPPVSTGSYTVYANGTLGGGDGNWTQTFDDVSMVTNYKDTSGKPQSGSFDLKITGGQQWPIWMPYANNPPKSFSMSNYTTVSFDIKTTVASDNFNFYFVPAGDEACPNGLTCAVSLPNAKYGPSSFTANTWYHITIPLADMGVPSFPASAVFKFGLQEDSGKVGISWFVNNVVFK